MNAAQAAALLAMTARYCDGPMHAGLDRALTDLSRTYDEQKTRMHLTPANARRVVDTALTLTAQPPLNNVGDDRTDAEVFAIPALGPAWQLVLRGLDTRLKPGELRHVTFDDQAAAGREDLVDIHLGHALHRLGPGTRTFGLSSARMLPATSRCRRARQPAGSGAVIVQFAVAERCDLRQDAPEAG